MEDPKAFRVAATVLVLRDDPFEVLMVRRHAKATFASRLVFPGGVIDPGDSDAEWDALTTGTDGLTPDERALRICALRETWEEASILLALDAGSPPEGMTDAPFRDVVKASGGRLALDRLHPFGHWITPVVEPRRFDTHFFLASAPADQIATVDGGETIALEWRSPSIVTGDEESFMFPTLLNLRRLAESTDSGSAFATADARTIFTVQPHAELRENGDLYIVIPSEAGYGVTEHLQKRMMPAAEA
jgi:8-oxo-dGTP pyrophosphatase MutT (NUDIX family)